MSPNRMALGRWGEEVAADYLQQRGYTILGRNVRTPYGELDLVARRGDIMVFVEVKMRSTEAFGLPEESVTEKKREHILASAAAFLQEHPELDGDWQVDVIAIQPSSTGRPPRITHFEHALS